MFPHRFVLIHTLMIPGDASSGGRLAVSPQIWIYFVVTIPITIIVVAAMLLWDRKREKKSKQRVVALETGLELMEKDILVQIRRHNTKQSLGLGHKDHEDYY